MFNWLKKLIFWFWNPSRRPFRDNTGKIIDDWKRRKHIKETKLGIKNGDIVLAGSSPRRYSLEKKGKITVSKQLKENVKDES